MRWLSRPRVPQIHHGTLPSCNLDVHFVEIESIDGDAATRLQLQSSPTSR